MQSLRITIASPPDRERLVAEVFHGDVQVAEINQETDRLAVEIYPRPDGQPWRLDLEALLRGLGDAKGRLVSR